MDHDGTDPVLLTNVKPAYQPTWVFTAAESDDNTGQVSSREGTDDGSTLEAIGDWRKVDAAPLNTTLQAYIEEMNELQRQGNLPVSAEGVGDPRTLEVLEKLDPTGKEEVVRFLARAGLIQGVDGRRPVISLSQAELDGVTLRHADLRGADLIAADLDGADLREANLSGANLYGAYLSKAEMTGANLRGADLTGAQLDGADLSGANLTNASLKLATLTGANLTNEYKSRVRAWEAEARIQLRDLTSAVNLCFVQYDPNLDLGTKLGHCTTSYEEYGGLPRLNITYQMIPQIDTGEVLIKVQHSYGGSGFQTSTASGGRIQRIPRF